MMLKLLTITIMSMSLNANADNVAGEHYESYEKTSFFNNRGCSYDENNKHFNKDVILGNVVANPVCFLKNIQDLKKIKFSSLEARIKMASQFCRSHNQKQLNKHKINDLCEVESEYKKYKNAYKIISYKASKNGIVKFKDWSDIDLLVGNYREEFIIQTEYDGFKHIKDIYSTKLSILNKLDKINELITSLNKNSSHKIAYSNFLAKAELFDYNPLAAMSFLLEMKCDALKDSKVGNCNYIKTVSALFIKQVIDELSEESLRFVDLIPQIKKYHNYLNQNNLNDSGGLVTTSEDIKRLNDIIRALDEVYKKRSQEVVKIIEELNIYGGSLDYISETMQVSEVESAIVFRSIDIIYNYSLIHHKISNMNIEVINTNIHNEYEKWNNTYSFMALRNKIKDEVREAHGFIDLYLSKRRSPNEN